MHASYKRYWEPSTSQALFSSVTVGAIATVLTQPIDLVKTRIQQRSEGIGIRQISHYAGYNPHKVFREVHAQGLGFRAFYAGIDSALLARTVHLFTRNLVYKLIYDRVKPRKPFNDLTNREKAVLGSFAGTIAAVASNPFEVALVRQQADGALPLNKRRGYTSFMDAYGKIVAQEGGFSALFKGLTPHILRTIVLNSSFTIPYNYMKEGMWQAFGDMEAPNRFIALVWGAFWASAATLPFDNLKFRYQYAFPDQSLNRLNYGSLIETIRQVTLVEGWQGFWAGFYSMYAKTFFYGLATIYMMDAITDGMKESAGLAREYW